MIVKIIIESLIKIYGKKYFAVFKLFWEGKIRDDILKFIGNVLGLVDVFFEIGKGELFVVMGLFGLGKFILVCCINCLVSFISGYIYIDGEDVVYVDEKWMWEIWLNKILMVF